MKGFFGSQAGQMSVKGMAMQKFLLCFD